MMTVDARDAQAVCKYLHNKINVNDAFEITFQYLENDEFLKVFLRMQNETAKKMELDVDYKIENSDGASNVWGKVVFLKEFLDVRVVFIVRDIENNQGKIFDSQTIFSETTENALDKLTMLLQDGKFKSYTLHVPDDEDVTSASLELPSATVRKNKYLMFDSKGKPQVGLSDTQTKALRQAEGEEDDGSFVVHLSDRKNKIVSFDEEGHVDLRDISSTIYHAGEHIKIENNVISATSSLSSVVYRAKVKNNKINKKKENLSEPRACLAAASIENYALFAGGQKKGEGVYSNQIDCLKINKDGSFIKTTENLNTARSYIAAGSMGKYFLFGGGGVGNKYTDEVDVLKLNNIDGTFTKSMMRLSAARGYLAASGIDNLAFFGGGIVSGSGASDIVDVFVIDQDEKISASVEHLSLPRYRLAATSVGNCIIFGGGYNGTYSDVVDIFKINDDGTITKSIEHLSVARTYISATSVGNCAIFAGGYESDIIDIFRLNSDGTFTHTTEKLSIARRDLAATSVGEYGIFAGGVGGGETLATIDVINLDMPWEKQKQTISIPGITSIDVAVVDVVLSDDVVEAKQEMIEWKKINRITTNDGSITIECFDELPNVDLNIILKV